MKGKLLFLLVGVLAFFSLQNVGKAQEPKPVIFKADITVAQEVPAPTPSLAIGAGVFVLNAERTELAYAVTFTGMSGQVVGAHFHGPAAMGVAAGVKRTICAPCESGKLITGVWSSMDMEALTPERVQDLLNGQIYFNAHTEGNLPGEIRGQLFPVSVP
ncbi:MAG: CHRD domain-containing protein [Acidobacteria bacterium]|nr:CHRD domain-containing protein [Acidobacteriota bacterium]